MNPLINIGPQRRQLWATIACLLICSISTEVFAMKGRYVTVSLDGQSFKSQNGLDEIKLDFASNSFSIISGSEKVVVPLDRKLQERGEFFYITRAHALWVLRSPVESRSHDEKIGVEGIRPQSPMILFFDSGKEKYRITYQQLGFSKINEHIGVGDHPKNYHWREPLEIYVPSLAARTARAAAFIPKVVIQEIETGKRVALEVMTGRLIRDPAPVPHPAEPMAPSDSDQAKRAQAFQTALTKSAGRSQLLLEITNWYAAENKKLAAKADAMPDKELNQAVEKLTADYNRKMLKAQLDEDPLPASTPMSKSEPHSVLRPDPSGHVPHQLNLDPKVSFMVPGCFSVKRQTEVSNDEIILDTPPGNTPPGVQIEVMPTLTFKRIRPDQTRDELKESASKPVNKFGFYSSHQGSSLVTVNNGWSMRLVERQTGIQFEVALRFFDSHCLKETVASIQTSFQRTKK